jgi:hypothetical protein
MLTGADDDDAKPAAVELRDFGAFTADAPPMEAI